MLQEVLSDLAKLRRDQVAVRIIMKKELSHKRVLLDGSPLGTIYPCLKK